MATLRQKVGLLRGLLDGQVAHTGPLFVDVDVTERCNLQCIGCMYHSPLLDHSGQGQRDIPLKMLEKLSSELRGMGTRSIILQGAGEPLLHPDIAEIIATFKDAGFAVKLLTNGTLLNRKNAQKLIKAGLNVLQVSLWATTPEHYRAQYPGTSLDTFELVIENLRLFSIIKAESVRTTPLLLVHYPINANNYQSIDRLIDLAQSAKCSGVSFAPWYAAGASVDQFSLSTAQERDVVQSLGRAKRRAESLNIHHNLNQVLSRYRIGKAIWESCPCYIAWFHARIRVNGDVDPCGRCKLSLGSLQEWSFPQLWNESEIRAFRRSAMTLEGVTGLRAQCDCTYCCFAVENLQVHRFFRWFAPLAPLVPRRRSCIGH